MNVEDLSVAWIETGEYYCSSVGWRGVVVMVVVVVVLVLTTIMLYGILLFAKLVEHVGAVS